MQTRHLYRLNGICTQTNGLFADVVNVTLFQKIAGVLVIGAEHTPAKILWRFDQGHQCFQISGGGAFANHDELPQTELAHGILLIGTFVVGVNTCGDVGI